MWNQICNSIDNVNIALTYIFFKVSLQYFPFCQNLLVAICQKQSSQCKCPTLNYLPLFKASNKNCRVSENDPCNKHKHFNKCIHKQSYYILAQQIICQNIRKKMTPVHVDKKCKYKYTHGYLSSPDVPINIIHLHNNGCIWYITLTTLSAIVFQRQTHRFYFFYS